MSKGILAKQIRESDIMPGKKVTVQYRTPTQVIQHVAVVEKNYRNHVLLNFGKYKECRLKTDILLKTGDVV